MLRLLQFLFTGCFHKWNTIDEGKLFQNEDDSMPIGAWYNCRCSKCGAIKRFNLK